MRVAAISAAAVLASFAASAQQVPPCMPADAEICSVMGRPEFVSEYRKAYVEKLDLADAIADIRINLRQAAIGPGAAGPAAFTKQLNAALDEALAHVQTRICKRAGSKGEAVSAAAEGFANAGRKLGVSLPPGRLGGITGSFMGSLEGRDMECLCRAGDFSAVRTTC